MCAVRSFQPGYLTRGLKYTLLVSIVSGSGAASAVPVVGPTPIDVSTPLQSYELKPGASLTGVDAKTLTITMGRGNELRLTGSSVTSAASDLRALTMNGGEAWINGSTITGSSAGMLVGASANTASASAHVYSSTISGLNLGVQVGPGAALDLHDSTVTSANGRGILMFNGKVQAQGGLISGGLVGISLWHDTTRPGGINQIELDGTRVVGQSGAAIELRPDATATILIANGTTLSGGNGNLIESGAGTADVTVDNSQLTGDMVAAQEGTLNLTLQNNASLTGRLTNVDRLAVDSQAQWVMVENSALGDLALNGGSVKFGDPKAYYALTLNSLSGNGTFVMDADFVTGEHDFLNVTGEATGNHTLLIGSSGQDPVAENQLHVVHIDRGDAQFSLLNGPVDLGAFSYDVRQTGNDWYLDTSTRVVSPGTRVVTALFNAAPTVWYGELSTLRSRMGELRMDAGKSGGWIRAYGNRYNVSTASGVDYQQNQQGLSFGADGKVPGSDGQWLAGLLGGYSTSDLDVQRGTSGKVDSFYVGAYTTWMDAESGYYVDGVIKLNRFQNKADVQLSDGTKTKGHYDNHGVGASLEVGRHIKFDDGYFIEPYTQLSGVIIQNKDYRLDNGLSVEGERTHSLLGKTGVTAGRNFDLGSGRTLQPYVRVAYAHEFAKDNKVQVNDNVFDNDLSGSRGELGAGIAVQLAERVQAHIDFDYSRGDNIEQPWGTNVGVRYSW